MKRALKISLVVLALLIVTVFSFRAAALLRESQPLDAIRPVTGQAISTDLGDIFVTTTGTTGPDLLLIHGTGAWGGLWQETATALAAEGYTAHAMDLPPFGFSDRSPDWDYSRDGQADRILALVAAMDMKPILVAHSFGASAGVEAVLKSPESFAGLVIVSGALGLGSHEAAKPLPLPLRSATIRRLATSLTATNPLATKLLFAQMMYRKDAATEARAEILRLPLNGEGMTESVATWSTTLLSPPRDARSTRAESYRNLSLPTALIWGDKDTVTPLAQGQALAELVPGAALTVLPDVGHIPQVEDPASFQRALFTALSGISAGATTGE